MNLISIGGEPCIATRLSYTQDTSVSKTGGIAVVQSIETSGSMLLFWQGEGPIKTDEYGAPIPVDIYFREDDTIVAIKNTLFSGQDPLPNYEKCNAARVEWVAKDIEFNKIEKDISTRITI